MHPIRRGTSTRLLTALFIAIGILGAMAVPTGAQENGLASITIYASLCPENYQDDNYYEDCYDTPAGAGIGYTLTELNTGVTYSGTSYEDGFGAIEGIDEDGFYQLSFDVPFPISSAPGNCSEDGEPFQVGSEYQMDLTTDNDIRCDIFISPQGDDSGGENGTLTIYKTNCPAGYQGTDYFNDCYDNPVEGVTFSAAPQQEPPPPGENGGSGLPITAVTNANGVATLTLPQFTWNVNGDIPGEFIDRFFVYCSLNGQRHEIGINDFGILVDIPGGADVRCDWYNVPSDLQGETGSVTIYKTACPPGYTGNNYFRDCYNNPEAGIGFGAYATKLDFEATGNTDANGFLTLPLPDGNTIDSPITLSQIPAVEVPKGSSNPPFFLYCSVDGERIDVFYNLVQRDPATTDIYTASISPNSTDDVRCDWYNLPPKQAAPSPSPSPAPTQPVTQLPSTGTGPATGSPVDGLSIGFTLLTFAGVASAVAVSRRDRKHAA